ncbi:hypothetical protein RvY_11661 [Ramazzottius varieornatus]|uniref:DUF659 domain-containing protein n=1 Tax=Ramazzottius varieornatus TaxID=947166 RepID=A0A1D1VL69_RAMVA|nr:hypothetical protein RvY_11661 [Ramazzottius varieornatus]
MEHKYGSTFRAVTCDSDGAHIKARRLLPAKYEHMLILACSSHQVNLIFKDVLKLVPEFKETPEKTHLEKNIEKLLRMMHSGQF